MTPRIRYDPPTPSDQDAELLGESITFPYSKRVLKSRFFKAATGERMFTWDQKSPPKRGIPVDRISHLYDVWGQGGYGVIITGPAIVDPEHIEIPGSAVIHESTKTPEAIQQFQKIARAGKANGSLVIMQLSHPGRKVPSYINNQPVSAGHVRLEDDEPHGDPTPLTSEGIQQVEAQFVHAAWVAHCANFDGIQISAMYDYLLAQFLSTKTNTRTDEYGGTLFNRSRIIREIIQKIRAKVSDPAFAIGIKIHPGEFCGQIKDAVEFCQELENLSVDFIELCGGAYKDPDSTVSPLEEFAKEISSSLTRTLVFISGGFRSSEDMATAVRNGHCASIGLGCPSSLDPDLPAQIISGRVGGATQPDPESANKALISAAVGTQMEALARGDEVFDWSNPALLHEFKERLDAFQDKRREALQDGIVEAGYMVWSPGSGK